MSRRVLILEELSEGWSIRDHQGQVICVTSGNATEQLDQLRVSLQQQPRGQRVLILLASTSVYAVPLPTDQDIRRLPYQAQLYALETHLPFPAEEITAELPAASSTAFVIETDRYAGVIEAVLQSHQVVAVVPQALVQLQAYLTLQNRHSHPAHIILKDSSFGWSLFMMANKRVSNWQWFATISEVQQEMAPYDPSSLLYLNLNESDHEDAGVSNDLHHDVLNEEVVSRFTTKIANGKVRPWVNFYKANYSRRKERSQSQRAWVNVIYLAGVCLLAVSGALWWKADAYRRESLALETQQKEIFQQAFPTLKVPSAVFTRFQSERKKLTATRQNPSDAKLPTNAVAPLSRMLQVIQDDQSLIVKRISVSANESMLETIFRTHGEAQHFSEKLQQKKLFADAPASVQLDAKHVSSTFVARHEVKEAP